MSFIAGMTFWFCITLFTWLLGHFISRCLKVHFMLIKYTCDSKSQTLRMRYPFQSTGRPISHRNVWSFRVYMIPLRDFVPEWNSRPGTTTGVNSRRGDSRRHDILWWYHVNKCRAMRGNRTEWTSSGTRLARKSSGIMLTPPNSRLQKGLAEVKINIIIKLFYRLNIIVWENSQHFVTLPLVSQGNDVWRMSAEMTYSITYKYPDLGSASDWLCCVRNSNCNHQSEVNFLSLIWEVRCHDQWWIIYTCLSGHFARIAVVGPQNVCCFLRLGHISLPKVILRLSVIMEW